MFNKIMSEAAGGGRALPFCLCDELVELFFFALSYSLIMTTKCMAERPETAYVWRAIGLCLSVRFAGRMNGFYWKNLFSFAQDEMDALFDKEEPFRRFLEEEQNNKIKVSKTHDKDRNSDHQNKTRKKQN